MGNETAISIQGLCKRYGAFLAAPWRRGAQRNGDDPEGQAQAWPWALRDVNLAVGAGETLGVIGRNGAGKSTLLKVLAGVTPPTRGRVEVRGSLFPMIELNAGLHPDLTGRENVRLLGTVMGLSRGEIARKLPAIEAFCDLGPWLDRPVWQYSTGMLARLGFGVAMNVDADIVLIDEVLATGDLGFQKKCHDRIQALQGQGKTFLVVSHSPYQLERMCSRILLLDQGRAVAVLEPRDVFAAYFELINRAGAPAEAKREEQGAAAAGRPGTGAIRVREVAVLDHEGRPADCVRALKPMKLVLDFTAPAPVALATFRVRVFSASNVMVSCFTTTGVTEGRTFQGEHRLVCDIPKVLWMTDSYWVDVKVAGHVLLDMVPFAAPFKVVVDDPGALKLTGNAGLFVTEAAWSVS